MVTFPAAGAWCLYALFLWYVLDGVVWRIQQTVIRYVWGTCLDQYHWALMTKNYSMSRGHRLPAQWIIHRRWPVRRFTRTLPQRGASRLGFAFRADGQLPQEFFEIHPVETQGAGGARGPRGSRSRSRMRWKWKVVVQARQARPHRLTVQGRGQVGQFEESNGQETSLAKGRDPPTSR